MPTTRRRHQVTETPEVERALDLAASRWPGESRAQLLLRLVRTGSESLAQRNHDTVRARAMAIDASSGKYDDAFDENHLRALRQEWPE